MANYRDSWNEALRELKELQESGQLTVLEDLRDGLASAPTALVETSAGKNVGQLAVRLIPDPVGGLRTSRKLWMRTRRTTHALRKADY